MKYPYIGKGKESGTVVVMVKPECGLVISSKTWATKNGNFETSIDESYIANITREYLANTWGVVESKEHAEFIIELAMSNNLDIYEDEDSIECNYFTFNEGSKLFFYEGEDDLSKGIRKQITIPLPPKIEPLKNAGDNLVLGCEQDFKVARRIINELREEANCSDELLAKRDEWPCVGGDVEYAGVKCKVLLSADKDGYIVVDKNGNYANPHIDDVIKPKTPEEALRDEIINDVNNAYHYETDEEEFADMLIRKYNITPKEV